MKEIAVQISRLDQEMVRRCYYHCLTVALEDLEKWSRKVTSSVALIQPYIGLI